MKWVKRTGKGLLLLVMLGGITCFIPSSEIIAGPQTARLALRPENLSFTTTVIWSDLVLNDEGTVKQVAFDEQGTARLPVYTIHTSLGRQILKHGLGLFGIIPGCDTCNAPRVDVFLDPPADLATKGFWLAQQHVIQGDEVVFEARLVPDEKQHPTRDFTTQDAGALLRECSLIIARGDRGFVPPTEWGPRLQEVNPVRVEIRHGTALLWMGGPVGYAVPAHSKAHPLTSFCEVFPTSFPQVSRIERPIIPKPLPGVLPALPGLPPSTSGVKPGP